MDIVHGRNFTCRSDEKLEVAAKMLRSITIPTVPASFASRSSLKVTR